MADWKSELDKIKGQVALGKGKPTKPGYDEKGDPIVVDKAFPQGFSDYYDDSWGPLLQQISGGGSPENVWANILDKFKGKEKDLQRFMHLAGPFIATSLFQSPAYKTLQDFEGLDKSMAAYGAGAGRIGQAAGQGALAGAETLGRAGLGRSGARAGLAQQSAQQSASMQGNLFADMYQRAGENRARYASQALDATQGIMGMALGMRPGPRIKQPKQGLGGQIAGALGGALGGFFGGSGFAGLLGGGTGQSGGGFMDQYLGNGWGGGGNGKMFNF